MSKNTVHSCEERGCKGEMTNGANLICNECKKKWYLECLIEENDIFELMMILNIVVKKNEKYTYNITTETKKALEKVIGSNEAIRYACNMCRKKTESVNDKAKKLERENKKLKDEINNLKTKLEDECETVKEMNEQNEIKSELLNEKNQMIKQLTNENEVMKKTAKNVNTKNGDVDEMNGNTDSRRDDSEKMNINKINELIERTITNEMNKLSIKLDEKLLNECKKIEKKITLREKETESNDNNKEKEKNNGNSNINRNNIASYFQARQTPKTTRNVTFNRNDREPSTSNEKNETQPHKQNEKIITFDEKLKPAKQQQQKENKCYEIYVSQFGEGTQIEYIEQHILNNTSILNTAFKVEEIISNNNARRPSYVAFKITTLKYDVYNEIMNIWAPKFTAREFRQTEEVTSTRKRTNRYNEHADYRNDYDKNDRNNRTPRKSSYKRMPYTNFIQKREQQPQTPRREKRYETKDENRQGYRNTPIRRDYNKNNQNNNNYNETLGNQQIYYAYPYQPVQNMYQPRPQPINFLGNQTQMRHQSYQQQQQPPPPPTAQQQQQQQQNQ